MNEKRKTGTLAWSFVAALAIVLISPARAAGQTVVVGTGDPNMDIPAVQAAVDLGGEVILKGQFSFDRPPTVPTGTAFVGGSATVLVSKAVTISGLRHDEGDMTTIHGGTTPFYVDAAGSAVKIQGLRFVGPKGDAILVYAVNGLVIASCRIEGVETVSGGGEGIDVITSQTNPTPTNPGKPGNVSGTLQIVDNEIDVGGTAQDSTVGVLIFSVGVPGAEVEAHVSGNEIRNTTEPAINLRRVVGRAYVERNVLRTGTVAGTAARPQVIRVANTGSYLIARNSIECEWAHPEAEGIGVFTQFAQWPVERAIVVENDVTMSPPEGTVLQDFSAGIGVYGFANDSVVLSNRIRGRARAALLVRGFQGGIPANDAFVLNRFNDFEASAADVFVGDGATNTLIVGQGTVEDHGTGTQVVPLPDRPAASRRIPSRS